MTLTESYSHTVSIVICIEEDLDRLLIGGADNILLMVNSTLPREVHSVGVSKVIAVLPSVFYYPL